jgi:hypothetical protein
MTDVGDRRGRPLTGCGPSGTAVSAAEEAEATRGTSVEAGVKQSVPLGVEIPKGLPEQEGEPQVAQIPEGPSGLAGKVPRYLQW